ncbi:MAG: type II toxin-antitoxin system Phd/YefM family antitoxin [Treponemataceae bacterium]
MSDLYPHWTAAEAKASLSAVMDKAGESPQIIDRHGKPAGVVIGWDLYSRHRDELEGTMKNWLKELAAINEREDDMDPIVRSDRPVPDGLDS